MGAKFSKKQKTKPTQKFLGSQTQYANLARDIKPLYKKVTGKTLVNARLKTEQQVLTVLAELDKLVYGAVQQGKNLPGRVSGLQTKASEPTQFLVTSSDSSPIAGADVTITAQFADKFDDDVAKDGLVVTWSSTNGGSFASPTSTTTAAGTATVVFTTSGTPATDHTVTAMSAPYTGTSDTFTTVPGTP